MARNKKLRMPPVTTIIGHGSMLAGGIEYSGGLHIDGFVGGDVLASEDAASSLTVSEGGSIEGNVRVQYLRLDGRIVGDVYVDKRVQLGARARIDGDLYYGLLEMAMGAEVNGELKRLEPVNT